MSHLSGTSPRAPTDATSPDRPQPSECEPPAQREVIEIGGPKGPEPTRYGDWEKGGQCTDF
jgi:hypothetical protein